MNNAGTNRKLLLIGGAWLALLVLAVVVTLFVHHRSQEAANGPGSTSYNLKHQTPEKGGPAMVDIQGMNDLAQILLNQEFSAVKAELNAYILTHISPTTVSAQVTNTTSTNNGLAVSFNVQTSQPARNFTVNLTRARSITDVFSVPSAGFQTTIQVYGTVNGN